MPVPRKTIVIGARGSLLSLAQAEEVISFFKRKFPQYTFCLKKITTQGDKLKTWTRNAQGIFVKEIEEALLNKEIDLAIHSMKDLPVEIPSPLELKAVTKRQDPRDVLISKRKTGLFGLKKRALIGTSSLRRSAQLLHWRPDLRIKQLRGNLDTRIRKLKCDEFDAIVIAAAGILRLRRVLGKTSDLPRPSSTAMFCLKEGRGLFSGLYLNYLSPRIFLPAAGQGALGIEARQDERIIEDITAGINDRQSFICVTAERVFLKELGGGCRVPIGALAQIKNSHRKGKEDKRITLEVAVISLDGKRMVRWQGQAPLDSKHLTGQAPLDSKHLTGQAEISEAEFLGKRLAREILERGGREILEENKCYE